MSPLAVHNIALIAAQLLVVGNICAQIVAPAFVQNTPDLSLHSPDLAVILAVIVNGLPDDPGVVFLQDDAGNLYAPAAFLEDWNLLKGAAHLQTPDGIQYFRLGENVGVTYSWNHARAELYIDAIPGQFLPTTINVGAGYDSNVSPYTPGGYLNYDLAFTRSSGANSNAALVDLALFRGEGLLTSSHIGSTEGSARLMTTWQRDNVRESRMLRIGDSYNSTSSWGRGFLFGGIQYGTNFAVKPGFIPFATPTVSGSTLLPSTVDVYVDNALRSRQEVDAGPFSIQNLPVITGTGAMQIVVKDVLGREQVITQEYFASPVLLRKGLVDDSYEAGWLRHDYGQDSNDYAEPFAAATYRRGISSSLTGEASVEVQRDVLTGGIAVASTLPGIASIVESSLALSNADGLATGAMLSLRYSYLGQRWSANARMELYNRDFRQLGSNPASLPEQIGSAHVSAPLGQGTLSGSYLRRLNQGESLARIVNISYSRKLSARMFLSFTLLKPLSVNGGTVAALTLLFVGARNHVGSTTLSRQTDVASLYSDFQRAAPAGVGTGYRVAGMSGRRSSRQEVSVTRNQAFGTYRVDLVSLNDSISSRLHVNGSIATLGAGLHFGRGLDQGFAIVQAGDIGGVPVLLENQVIARTNRRGQALVPNLQAYQPNRISIDPLPLPLDTVIDTVEQIVIPRSQGGVLIDFRLSRMHSAILAIVQEDGTPLPPWTVVEVIGIARTYVTGNRGEVFVDLPNAIGNRIIARPLTGPQCELKVDQPAAGSTAPLLGPLPCVRSL